MKEKKPKTLKQIIKAKKYVFYDFCIPWNVEIEHKFKAAMEMNPHADPECTLDRICRPYIERKLAWTEADKMKVQKGV